jgi:mannose-6-phosphate isomerase-like protein (cupin superfamily)
MTMIKPLVTDVRKSAEENDFFRSVIFTGTRSQLVLMSLLPDEEIGAEVHDVDQILYIVKGEGKAVLDGVDRPFSKGSAICVPAGVHHNVINTGEKAVKLFTVYAPPEHAAGTVHKTRAEAEAAEKAEKKHAMA